MNTHTEQVIRAAWKRDRDQCDPETHGRGLLPVHLPADTGMGSPGMLGTPIRPYDGLEFRLEQSNVNGQTLSAIVCEGVIVDRRSPGTKRPRSHSSRRRISQASGPRVGGGGDKSRPVEARLRAGLATVPSACNSMLYGISRPCHGRT
jgi:hypothetical protein